MKNIKLKPVDILTCNCLSSTADGFTVAFAFYTTAINMKEQRGKEGSKNCLLKIYNIHCCSGSSDGFSYIENSEHHYGLVYTRRFTVELIK